MVMAYTRLDKKNLLLLCVLALVKTYDGDLIDAGVNRCQSAYLNNPADERSKYQYNVDKEMTLAKFVDDQLGPVGSFNWFATHGTSMSRTNSLISGDNKGAAAHFMQDWAEQNVFPKQAAHANSYDLGSLHMTSGHPRRVYSYSRTK